MKNIILPKGNNQEEIEVSQSVLLVGANGSGKTRLGSWIEIQSPQKSCVHRISAQKVITLPDSTTPTSIDLAEKDLLYGNPSFGPDHKLHKWGKKPATQPLSDFQKLMTFLFSDETEKNAEFKRESKISSEKISTPVTRLDQIKDLWEGLLPHRELIIGGLRIQTRVKNQDGAVYNSSEMSDGERVIFYLIGQCLAAQENGIIIIDEPEIHLHKAIQVPLWNAIEKLREDCLFVYLTHDVDFAAAKENARKIWLKGFDGQNWDWEIIKQTDGFPNDLLLEVLGSRKPVVFVEGTNGSLDVSLYRELLPDFLVIPRGGCNQVIESVKVLKSNPHVHHLDVYGIVDRDRRVDEEIARLKEQSVFVLEVAEVENLFCTKEVLEVVSARLERDPIADFQQVQEKVFSRLQKELDVQVSLRVSRSYPKTCFISNSEQLKLTKP